MRFSSLRLITAVLATAELSPVVSEAAPAPNAAGRSEKPQQKMPVKTGDDLVALAQQLEEMDFGSPEFLSHLTADMTFDAAGPRDLLPWAGVWKGPDGVKGFRQALAEKLKYTSWKPIAWLRDGDTVIELAHVGGIAKETGKPYESDLVRLWVFKDRKVARMISAYDTLAYAEAIGAVARTPAAEGTTPHDPAGPRK